MPMLCNCGRQIVGASLVIVPAASKTLLISYRGAPVGMVVLLLVIVVSY